MTAAVAAPTTGLRARLRADAVHLSRTMLVAVPLGMLSVGVVARLAMRLLAAMNPPAAGLLSDDGFVIDQVTLTGSLNLLLVGAVFGALSGVLHVALAPLGTGPAWFRSLSLSVGAGVVVGSQLVHPDGVDFVLLQPYGLAAGLFVLIPVLHVLALDLLVARGRSAGPSGPGRTATGLLLALPMAPLVLALGAGRVVLLLGRQHGPAQRVLGWAGWPWLLRGVLAVLFVIAAAELGSDVRALAAGA